MTRRDTLKGIAGILAFGVAPSVLGGTAGLRKMLGARIGAWSGEKSYCLKYIGTTYHTMDMILPITTTDMASGTVELTIGGHVNIDDKPQFVLQATAEGDQSVAFYTNGGIFYNSSCKATDEKCTLSFDVNNADKVIYNNGVQYAWRQSMAWGSWQGYPIRILGSRYDSQPGWCGRFYEAKFTNGNGTVVCDCVPDRRGNVIDLVSGNALKKSNNWDATKWQVLECE